ncbi:MAG: KilA-N domain-containing protein [Bacteroidota bacterium]
MAKKKITVENIEVRVNTQTDYICITDVAKSGRGRAADIIRNYLKNRSTIEFLEAWEMLHNEGFKVDQAINFKNEISANDFAPSIGDWIKGTGAKGIVTRPGRYGGTYAHKDIAFHFAMWLNARFYLYIVKDYQQLKESEAKQLDSSWSVRREIAKANFQIHIDAINKALPANVVGTKKAGIHFASEADLLNTVVFGMTAKQWRAANPKAKGNIRDHASTLDLLILSNLEVLNAKLIQWDSDQGQRLELLEQAAAEQRGILSDSKSVKRLSSKKK